MHDLIKIQPRDFSGAAVQTVNARDLHTFLEVGKDFSTWIKGRIEQYGFVEHHDFVTDQNLRSPVLGSTKARAQIAIDYHLSLDMAKELAMVERFHNKNYLRHPTAFSVLVHLVVLTF